MGRVGGLLLWMYLFLGFGIFLGSATSRNSILFSGEDTVTVVQKGGRRSLKSSVDDYGDPTANKGHDPKNKGGGGVGGGGVGRRN